MRMMLLHLALVMSLCARSASIDDAGVRSTAPGHRASSTAGRNARRPTHPFYPCLRLCLHLLPSCTARRARTSSASVSLRHGIALCSSQLPGSARCAVAVVSHVGAGQVAQRGGWVAPAPCCSHE